ncbi:MAG: hypothetical protein SVZ03_00675 [Spirochaetota bacterium]|nr:hypothetical protein [Spirochaetota bacterium]
MSRRKQYLVDKKLQFKTAFMIIGVVTILTALVISAIVFIMVYNNNKIDNILHIQNNIAEFLNSRISLIENREYKNVLENIALNHSSNDVILRKITQYNKILMFSIIIFAFAQGGILYILLIRITHRISGPIYLMSMYIKDIIKGEYPSLRSLRSKDELKDFYGLFKQMVTVIKERDNR